jgi:4-amino-4-deoxy-L-arabinose transferase-like glycosyltransferase
MIMKKISWGNFLAMLGVAAVSFLAGVVYGDLTAAKENHHWQRIIDDCHRFLENGLDADFGRCIAGSHYRSE